MKLEHSWVLILCILGFIGVTAVLAHICIKQHRRRNAIGEMRILLNRIQAYGGNINARYYAETISEMCSEYDIQLDEIGYPESRSLAHLYTDAEKSYQAALTLKIQIETEAEKRLAEHKVEIEKRLDTLLKQPFCSVRELNRAVRPMDSCEELNPS